MKRRWVRVTASRADNMRSGLAAGMLAAGVGIATFYVVRLVLAREPLGESPVLPSKGVSSGSDEDAR